MTTSSGKEKASDAGVSDLGSDGSFLREVARAGEREPPAPEPNRVGARLGKYRVEEKLGAGGMGIVYRALDEKLDRAVALKVLKPRLDLDPEQRRRFVREARAASAVRHPNVAAVYEVGEEADVAFIAMELVPGAPLRDRLSGGPLPVAEAVRIALEIARALEAAHAVGIVHRDLKPDNVVIEPAGRVKVLDFGLARRVLPEGVDDAKAETVTVDGRISGTPGYMSPEQARGLAVDARSDLFSLGVVLFELLTGERPFDGETRMDVIVATSRDAAPLVSARRRDVPRALVRVVASMLEKDPARRPASAKELIAALEVAARSTGPRRRTWELGALVGVGVLATAFFATRGPSRAAMVPEPSVSGTASVPEAVAPTAEPSAALAEAEPSSVASVAAPPIEPTTSASVRAARKRVATPPSGEAGVAKPRLDPLGDQK